jgi:hypothetical protein
MKIQTKFLIVPFMGLLTSCFEQREEQHMYLAEESNYTENGLVKRYFKVKIIQP